MARSHARILTSIWANDDFLALTSSAQRLYILAVSQPGVSMCGVVAYTERRWARLASDTDPQHIRDALAELEAHRFVMIDETTDEVFIRSFVASDQGVLKTPNVLRSMVTDFDGILSPRIKRAFLWEWHTKLAGRVQPRMDKPQWPDAVEALSTLPPKPSQDPWTEGRTDPRREGRGEGPTASLAASRGEGPMTRDNPTTTQPHLNHPHPSTRPSSNNEPTEHADAPGGPATPATQPEPQRSPADAVLDRIIGEAPADVGPRIRDGLNGQHAKLVDTALRNGWSPAALVARVTADLGSVREPAAVLAHRLQPAKLGRPPPKNRPPDFDADDDARHARMTAETADPATAKPHIDAIRRNLGVAESETS